MSTLHKIKKTVVEILAPILNQNESDLYAIPLLTHYQWDSLITLTALVQLENTFHIRFDLRKYYSTKTIDDIVALVAEKKFSPQ